MFSLFLFHFNPCFATRTAVCIHATNLSITVGLIRQFQQQQATELDFFLTLPTELVDAESLLTTSAGRFVASASTILWVANTGLDFGGFFHCLQHISMSLGTSYHYVAKLHDKADAARRQSLIEPLVVGLARLAPNVSLLAAKSSLSASRLCSPLSMSNTYWGAMLQRSFDLNCEQVSTYIGGAMFILSSLMASKFLQAMRPHLQHLSTYAKFDPSWFLYYYYVLPQLRLRGEPVSVRQPIMLPLPKEGIRTLLMNDRARFAELMLQLRQPYHYANGMDAAKHYRYSTTEHYRFIRDGMFEHAVERTVLGFVRYHNKSFLML